MRAVRQRSLSTTRLFLSSFLFALPMLLLVPHRYDSASECGYIDTHKRMVSVSLDTTNPTSYTIIVRDVS